MFGWTYLWTEDAGWKRLRANAALEHLRGQIALTPCRDGVVRLASVVGSTQARRALEVLRIDFSTHPVNERGFMTAEQASELMALAMESAVAGTGRKDPAVIDARGKFYQRRRDARYRWKPSTEAVTALCDEINRRAGQVLLSPRRPR